jgi:hypothetical protein
MVTDILVDAGSLATAVGVIFAGAQLWISRRQSRTQFEESLSSRYRDIVSQLPVGAFLDEAMSPDELQEARSAFYRYFDLCNEQAFLNEQGRISDEAWEQWRDGIESNMRRRAFEAAWSEIEPKIGGDFDEFRRVLASLPSGLPSGRSEARQSTVEG